MEPKGQFLPFFRSLSLPKVKKVDLKKCKGNQGRNFEGKIYQRTGEGNKGTPKGVPLLTLKLPRLLT